jgi:hypothetical protein
MRLMVTVERSTCELMGPDGVISALAVAQVLIGLMSLT